jgi:hypothetical protein
LTVGRITCRFADEQFGRRVAVRIARLAVFGAILLPAALFAAMLNAGANEQVMINSIISSNEYFTNALPEPAVGAFLPLLWCLFGRKCRAGQRFWEK